MLQVAFFPLKFVGIDFISLSFDLASFLDVASTSATITSSQIIAESSITLVKYFPFSQLYVSEFQA